MRSWSRLALACGFLALAPTSGAQTAPAASPPSAGPPPVEAFGRLPAAADAAMSPDGSKVVLAAAVRGPLEIMVIDLARREFIYGRGVGTDTQLRGVGWADDGRVSFQISRTFAPNESPLGYRMDYARFGSLDLASERVSLFVTGGPMGWLDVNSYLIAPIEGDPGFGRMLGPQYGMGRPMLSLYRVNLADGRTSLERPSGVNPDTVSLLIDERGAALARADSDDRTNRWRVFTYDNGAPRQLLEGVSETGYPISLVGLLADGRLAAIDEDENNDLNVLYAIDRASGAKEIIFRQAGADVDYAILDPWTRRVVGVGWADIAPHQRFFDSGLEEANSKLESLRENGSARIESWSRDRTKVLVYIERGLDGGGYYAFTPATNALMPLFMRYPELANAQLGDRQSITYPARDGTRIPAYLTLPPGSDGRNMPLVLLVHGGPFGVRDDMDFDYMAAFFASRGYAVLQPNYRGSGGYGSRWERAGYKQWGGLMQSDLTDGVAALVQSGIANASRVCIVGASYGGYAALAGATLTPDRYTCAASIAGVSDMEALVREGRGFSRHSARTDWMSMAVGNLNTESDRLRAVSPVHLADRVRIPILLIHGQDDTVVPISHSQRMYDRLIAAGKNARLVRFRNDDHWLSDAETRIQTLRELETFLAQNIGPQAQR